MTNSSTEAPVRSSGRVPPHNLQAEQSVLGAAMSGKRALAKSPRCSRPRIFTDQIMQ